MFRAAAEPVCAAGGVAPVLRTPTNVDITAVGVLDLSNDGNGPTGIPVPRSHGRILDALSGLSRDERRLMEASFHPGP